MDCAAERSEDDVWRFALVVADLDRSVAWYVSNLDFEVEARWDAAEAPLRFAQLRAGDVRFELMERDGPSPEPEVPPDPIRVPGLILPGRDLPPPGDDPEAAADLDGEVVRVVLGPGPEEQAGLGGFVSPELVEAGAALGVSVPAPAPTEDHGRVRIMRDPDGRRIELVEPEERRG